MDGPDDAALAVREAFSDVPRPGELLHPRCLDDNDLAVLEGTTHWRDLSWQQVQNEYAALGFLSPAGFAHFIPAYLLGVLEHPDSPAAVVDSTVWAFCLSMYPEPVTDVIRSHLAALDEQQVEAVRSFLRTMEPHHPDAHQALEDVDGMLDRG